MAKVLGTTSRARRPERRRWLFGGAFCAGALLAATIAVGNAAQAAPATKVPSTLWPGTTLPSRGWLSSRNGYYHLYMQRDGNLVLYRHNGSPLPLWQSDTGHHWGASLVMQRDGNLVIYYDGHPLWSSGTDHSGDAGAAFVVQNDGNMVIYSRALKAIWSSDAGMFPPLPVLSYGATGPDVVSLQHQLSALGYWVGPADGTFGDAVQQALWALQKAAGLPRTGILDSATDMALRKGVRPTIRPAAGNLVEVNLSLDLLLIVRNGKLFATLNTSTGGGYWYTSQGVSSQAITPTGVFSTYYEIDGVDVAPLGTLFRPKFFSGGDAIHGDSYVPPVPVSHGCVRVSDEAINWIWALNLDPLGGKVWVYS